MEKENYLMENPNGMMEYHHFYEGKYHKILEGEKIENIRGKYWISSNKRGIFVYSTELKERCDINLVGWECECYLGVLEQQEYLVVSSSFSLDDIDDSLLYIIQKKNLQVLGFFSTFLHVFFPSATKEDVNALNKSVLEQYIGESEYEKMKPRDYIDITKKFSYWEIFINKNNLSNENFCDKR